MSLNRQPAQILIVSFGYLHAQAPQADITLDLRRAFRDPHVTPNLRLLTGRDPLVRRTVLRTAGVRRLLWATTQQVQAVAAGPSAEQVVIGCGCAGGRHRSVVVADQLARRLRRRGHHVTVNHRDLHQPVINRKEHHVSSARHFFARDALSTDALKADIQADIKASRTAQRDLQQAGQHAVAARMGQAADETLDELNDVNNGIWHPKHA